jgi:hypothetical protein
MYAINACTSAFLSVFPQAGISADLLSAEPPCPLIRWQLKQARSVINLPALPGWNPSALTAECQCPRVASSIREAIDDLDPGKSIG